LKGQKKNIENTVILLKLETEPRITKSYLALEDEAKVNAFS